MHGGKGSGAPPANQNALLHGLYTKDVLAREARLRELGRRLRAAAVAVTRSGQLPEPPPIPSSEIPK